MPIPQTTWKFDFAAASRVVAGGVLALAAALPAQAQVLTGISPRHARLDVLMDFTVTGSGLSAVSIEGCMPSGAPTLVSPTLVKFRCTPQTPGPMRVSLGALATAERVMVDHPTRVGNPAARVIPAIAGVSLFNGNFFS